MGKCGRCFSGRQLSFHATSRTAQYTRSWSSGKMFAFQTRGFVFEPVRMRYFFYKCSEAEGVKNPFLMAHFDKMSVYITALSHFFVRLQNVSVVDTSYRTS